MPPQPAAVAPASDDAAMTSYHVAKTLREAAEARIAQFKLAELRGDLVRSSVALNEYTKLLSTTRETFLQLPARVVPVLAACSDAIEMDALLTAAIHDALRSLASAE